MTIKKSSLGEQLCYYRKKLGISQEYLADILRFDQTCISKTETGKRQLTVEDFYKWCTALNLSDDDIINILKSTGD